MRTNWLRASVFLAAFGGSAMAEDYVYSDAFETRICDGVGCSYCSPLDPQPLCGTHSHCQPQMDGSSMCTYPSGAGTQGATCTSPAACGEAYACIDTGLGSQCLHWCAGGGSGCQGGTSCQAFTPALLIGAQEWGVCF
jgi:hypothetical protein